VNEQVLDASTWSEAGNSIPSSDFTGTLRITLLSDAILNDPKSGQHSTSPQTILAAISPAFGGQIPDLSQCKIFSRSTIVGGFNRKWGLPLVQTVAVSMGSVIVIPVYRVSATGVATLIKSGIGQRRTEGYGRLAVNWQLNPSFKLQMHSLDVASRSENPPSNELTFVQNRLRQLRIEHEISSQAMQVRGEKIPKDCRSRVQNLRLQVLQEIRDNSSGYNETKGVGGYIAKIRNRRTVCDKYDRIRVRDSQTVKRILDWLKEFLSSRSSVTLTVPDLSNATSKQEQLKGAEAYKIRLRVAHLVLGRLVKESKRASRQNQGAE
jgi:CRISPR-associated protein Csx10